MAILALVSWMIAGYDIYDRHYHPPTRALSIQEWQKQWHDYQYKT
jgi:hypothetical protein